MTGEYEEQNSSRTDLNGQHLANQFAGFKSLHRHHSLLIISTAYSSQTIKNTVTRLSPTFIQ
jgi:hypothetical protein